jgi:hypothetical protein
MRKMATLMLSCVLGLGTDMLVAQQTSTTQTNPTQNKDIPRQQPGTNNPDLGQQRHEAPKSGTTKTATGSKRSHHRKHQSPNTAGSTKSTE